MFVRSLCLLALLCVALLWHPISALAGCRYLTRGIQLCCQRLDNGNIRCCYVFPSGAVHCMPPR